MKTVAIAAIALLSLVLLISLHAIDAGPAAQAAPAPPIAKWTTDLTTAKRFARYHDRLILASFSGSDWCEWCIRLRKEVFEKPAFARWAKDRVILLEVDFPRGKRLDPDLQKQNAELAAEFEIKQYPTLVLMDGDGKEVGRLGYVRGGPDAWIRRAEAVMARRHWLTSWDEAVRRAQRERKPILANFTGSDWCGWCVKLADEVFSTREFSAWALENVILLEIDFPRRKKLDPRLARQNERLKEKHGVRGYPTILFLDHRGRLLGRHGYVKGGPKAWIAAAEF